MARKNGNAADNDSKTAADAKAGGAADTKAAASKGNGADTGAQSGAGGAAEGDQAQAKPARVKTLNQFIRDMSFENVASSKEIKGEVQQEIQISVSLDSKSRGDDRYEVSIKINMDSKNKGGGEKIFVLEMEYVGIFELENVAQQNLHPVLMIECPRLIFPYLRRIVGDVTRDGGFTPLNLDQFDFLEFYRENMRRRIEQRQKEQEGGEKAKELSGTS